MATESEIYERTQNEYEQYEQDKELFEESLDIADSSKELIKSQLKTNTKINNTLCGRVVDLKDGYAKVHFIATDMMTVDSFDMIHPGFIFGSASFAAMAAINKPNSVLVVAKSNFLAPMELNDEAFFIAKTKQFDIKKAFVNVVGLLYGVKFFEAEYSIVVLNKHISSLKFRTIYKNKEEF